MTHPEFAKHGSFEHLRLGGKPASGPPAAPADRLDPTKYVPRVPSSTDYAAAVPKWPMYGNHHFEDCTCAAAGHLIQAWSASAGAPKTPTLADIETLYWQTGKPAAATGTRKGPTDNGREAPEVLNYWRETGVGGDNIAAWKPVDRAILRHLRAAIHLFGGVYAVLGLPITAKRQGKCWDVVTRARPENSSSASWGYHAVPYVAYDAHTFTCVTWGHTHKLTTAFHRAYAIEVFAVVSGDFFTGPRRPSNLDELRAELQYVAS